MKAFLKLSATMTILMMTLAGLSACNGTIDLAVEGVSVTTPIKIKDTNDQVVVLDQATANTISTISFYDFQGFAKMSFAVRGHTPALFSLGKSSKEVLDNLHSGVHVDAVTSGQNVSIDLKSTRDEKVHNEWDSTRACQRESSVTECVVENGVQVCREIKTIHHGTEPIHVVQDGIIYHYQLDLGQSPASASLGVALNKVGQNEYATGPCITID